MFFMYNRFYHKTSAPRKYQHKPVQKSGTAIVAVPQNERLRFYFCKMLLGQFQHNRCQQEHTDQVGYGHETVKVSEMFQMMPRSMVAPTMATSA